MGEGREKRRERGGPRKEFPRPMVTVIENFVNLTGYPTITQHGQARQGTPTQTLDDRALFSIFSLQIMSTIILIRRPALL